MLILNLSLILICLEAGSLVEFGESQSIEDIGRVNQISSQLFDSYFHLKYHSLNRPVGLAVDRLYEHVEFQQLRSVAWLMERKILERLLQNPQYKERKPEIFYEIAKLNSRIAKVPYVASFRMSTDQENEALLDSYTKSAKSFSLVSMELRKLDHLLQIAMKSYKLSPGQHEIIEHHFGNDLIYNKILLNSRDLIINDLKREIQVQENKLKHARTAILLHQNIFHAYFSLQRARYNGFGDNPSYQIFRLKRLFRAALTAFEFHSKKIAI